MQYGRRQGMEIETFDFTGNGAIDYVLIRIDIGKMPPVRANKYIANIRENCAIHEELKELGIGHDFVGVSCISKPAEVTERVEVTGDTEVNTIVIEDQSELLKAVLNDECGFDKAMKLVE